MIWLLPIAAFLLAGWVFRRRVVGPDPFRLPFKCEYCHRKATLWIGRIIDIVECADCGTYSINNRTGVHGIEREPR